MTATFPIKYQPEYSAELGLEQKVLTAQFGDGYEQRIADGINNTRRKWKLKFVYTTPDIDVIETFLLATKGVDSFNWTPPRGLVGKWVLQDAFQRNVENFGYESISATFREVFE